MAAIGRMNAQSHEKRNKLFNEYYNLAMKSFNAKNYLATINHCNSALNTRLQNSNVYYLRGVSYINIGLKRDGKKDLKKSAKSGNVNAKLYLNNMKSK